MNSYNDLSRGLMLATVLVLVAPGCTDEDTPTVEDVIDRAVGSAEGLMNCGRALTTASEFRTAHEDCIFDAVDNRNDFLVSGTTVGTDSAENRGLVVRFAGDGSPNVERYSQEVDASSFEPTGTVRVATGCTTLTDECAGAYPSAADARILCFAASDCSGN